jgi:hypothetical protein
MSVQCTLYRLHDEVCAITPHFSYPYGAMNFMPALGNEDPNSNSCTRWRGIFKGLSQDGGRTDFSENLHPSSFNKELLNETIFSQIHGQYF